jgi:hypothetical protein
MEIRTKKINYLKNVKKTVKAKTEFKILTGFAEKIASVKMNHNARLAAKMNVTNAILMAQNASKTAKMLKIQQELNVVQSARKKSNVRTVVKH